MLLYEFMENGSLHEVLFYQRQRHQLRWSVRYKVIIGIAKGVIYLHQESRPVTIHRDLNPSNILLDNEMNPKISGFSLARNIEDGLSELSTRIAGTMGYMSPEYIFQGRISEKTDVYSFGVLVLEMLSGRRIYRRNLEDLMQDAWKLWIAGNVLDLVDESLAGAFSEEEALRCIQVGLLCTQHDPKQRPTMSCALKMLLGEDSRLQEKVVQAQDSWNIKEHPWLFNSDNGSSESSLPEILSDDETLER